jgi:hypothetical protein
LTFSLGDFGDSIEEYVIRPIIATDVCGLRCSLETTQCPLPGDAADASSTAVITLNDEGEYVDSVRSAAGDEWIDIDK